MYVPGREKPVQEEQPPVGDLETATLDADPWRELQTTDEEPGLIQPYPVTREQIEPRFNEAPDVLSVKIVIAGGFGAGKSTFVGTISEIAPLKTDVTITNATADIDDLSGVPDKRTMTAALDFGRRTLERDLVLYIFGTPGVHRLWFVWDDLIQGAIGAVLLVDTRRLADAFPGVDYFEASEMPFIVAINGFHGQFPHTVNDVREALALPPGVPVVACDARSLTSAIAVLVLLVEHAMAVQASQTSDGTYKS